MVVQTRLVPNNPLSIAGLTVGTGAPLLVIAGPCVLEEDSIEVARRLKKIQEELAREGTTIHLIFKGSFDKANRSSLHGWRGLGMERGLEILARVREEIALPVTTDIHESYQAPAVGKVVDLIQIPAFLARQTDLLAAAAKTSRPVHVKKGQFMAPNEMKGVVEKLLGLGCADILLAERGTFFGYGQLVNDFRALPLMRALGTPVIFDATHSVQEPGGLGDRSGGKHIFVGPLARAAAAVGIDGLFLETLPEPEKSPSDAANILPLDRVKPLIRTIVGIRRAVQSELER